MKGTSDFLLLYFKYRQIWLNIYLWMTWATITKLRKNHCFCEACDFFMWKIFLKRKISCKFPFFFATKKSPPENHHK
jgi:hypothetical protein